MSTDNTDLTNAFIEICQVKARYCRTLDSKDWENYTELFTKDYVLDLSEDTRMAPIEGRDAAMAFVKTSIGNTITSHQVHIPLIELDEDGANVIWPLQDRLIWNPPKNGLASLTGYGQYHERYKKVNGEWKIARLKLTRFHMDFEKA